MDDSVNGCTVAANDRVSTGKGLRLFCAAFLFPDLGFTSRSGGLYRESYLRKSRMVEISSSGSGEGLGRATGRGYSTEDDNFRVGVGPADLVGLFIFCAFFVHFRGFLLYKYLAIGAARQRAKGLQ